MSNHSRVGVRRNQPYVEAMRPGGAFHTTDGPIGDNYVGVMGPNVTPSSISINAVANTMCPAGRSRRLTAQ